MVACGTGWNPVLQIPGKIDMFIAAKRKVRDFCPQRAAAIREMIGREVFAPTSPAPGSVARHRKPGWQQA